MANENSQFATFRRGQIRDEIILATWRNSLRNAINPSTGQTFSEEEIFRATQPGSRFYMEADAIDLWGMVNQAKGEHLANQLFPSRANSDWLRDYHVRLRLGENGILPAVGSSGTMFAKATIGSIFVGSTTIGAPAASIATDPNGFQYQVATTVTVTAEDDGEVNLSMLAIDTGLVTNIEADTVLTWTKNAPLGAEPNGYAVDKFSGGFDAETDQEVAERIKEIIRFRPAAGNAAHFRAWCREASVAVESAFVYMCALHAGSVAVCVLQKRGSTAGPLARVSPDASTMVAVTNYIVPPDTPAVAQRAFVLALTANPQSSDLVVQLSMGKGRSGGWYNHTPWPTQASEVFTVGSSTGFVMYSDDSELTGGAARLDGDDAPQLMAWNEDESSFERLDVNNIVYSGYVSGAGRYIYTVTLNSAPSHDIEAGDTISPYTDMCDVIASSTEQYFDTLGPGEVVNLSTDPRAHRAARFPRPVDKNPSRAGTTVLNSILDGLGTMCQDASLYSISRNAPDVPAEVIDGPNMVVLGKLSVYPLEE